jgi:hypothetical protein
MGKLDWTLGDHGMGLLALQAAALAVSGLLYFLVRVLYANFACRYIT